MRLTGPRKPWLALICAIGLCVAGVITLNSAGLARAGTDKPSIYNVRVDESGQKIYRSHAIAMHGEPKYGPDFKHFDYVNPNAPKGGTLRTGAQGTFDTFNPFNAKGNPFGAGAETLLTQGMDEAFTEYGLIAEEIEWPEDRSWVIFHLRPESRWHDGTPITVEDVIFSFDILKEKGAPLYRFYYASVERAVKVGERAVKFEFSEMNNRELPLILGQLFILPKHYWETRDFGATTLEPPLTSGPYRIVDFEPGRYVVRERVEDYWGKDLPVNVGQDNFDRIRTEYFRDDTVLRQALKSDVIDIRNENFAKAWALDYNIPAVKKGWLKKELIPHHRPTGMQALIFNTRRPLFQDRRVREALGYAFDFEWMNPTLFFDQYARNYSYFGNSELASSGLPKGEELEILEQFRGRVPEEVFAEEFVIPKSDGSGWPRDNLKKALSLLNEAGWEVRNLQLVNRETGEPFQFEMLLASKTFERILLPFSRNLRRLGIDARIRLVDQSQYINRLRSFDFDMISLGWGQTDSPGNEQRDYWGSRGADSEGSRNYAGIKNPAIDELIELVITAPDRESLVARTRALDRVLLWGFYVIPAWHLQADRFVYWNRFSRPEITPKDGTSLSFWWYDEMKSAALRAARDKEPSLAENSD